MRNIQVTQEHIDEGIQASCYACPLALAISEECQTYANVGASTVAINGHLIDLPPEAVSFIRSFDADGEVEPFGFALDI